MKKIIIVIALAMAAAVSYAAVNESVSISFPLLDMGAGARASAMGDAFTAVADDSSAVYWNTAGLGTIKRPEVSLTYNKWFMDTMFSQLLLAYPVSTGTIGFEAVYMNLGDMPIRDIYGITTMTVYPYILGGSLGYGISIGQFSAGAAIKIISQSTGNNSNVAFAGDAGVLIKAGMFSAGLSIQNAGYSGGYSLPMNIKAGAAIMPLDSPQHTLTLAIDSQYLFKDAVSISAGVEYVFMETLALRAGYKAGFGELELDGIRGISAGLGVRVSDIKIDYAVAPYGDLGLTHRVTLSLIFGSQKTNAAGENKAGTAINKKRK